MKRKTRKTIFGWQGMALFIALIAILMWLLTVLNSDMANGSQASAKPPSHIVLAHGHHN